MQNTAARLIRTLLAAALLAPSLGAQDAIPPYDILILNGRLVDGSGGPSFYGDLAIRGDRIAMVAPAGLLSDRVAKDTIDATGLVIAPGFIDILGQSGWYFLYGDTRLIAKVSQGVTTEIIGEGTTYAPLNPRNIGTRPDSLARRFSQPNGFGNFLEAMERRRTSVNVGAFVGGHTIRQYGMSTRTGPAPAAAVREMQGALQRAMLDGAFGMGTALIYAPGTFAGPDELIEVSKAMAEYDGLYVTHLRSEGDGLLDGLDEAIRIGREAGVRVEIWHLKAAGRRNWNKGPESIARIEDARATGLDIEANMYPYVAAATGLTSCIPPFAQGAQLYTRLANPTERARIRAEIEQPTSAWENLCALAGPEGVLIQRLGTDSLRRYSGQRLSQIAAARGEDWIETAFTLIRSERARVETIYFLMDEYNVQLNLRQPWMKIGSDAGGPNPRAASGLVHPRSYGTFTRVLGLYVRDQGVIPLEEAVRKMTWSTARRLGIQERGLLAPGFFADVVVFNPATINDRATFERPHQVSTGVLYTIVNGVPVWRNGNHTGAKPGRAVRGPAYRPGASLQPVPALSTAPEREESGSIPR
ncbi:MAG: D-aminoacylase [Gemmatimonadaceae bacterium]|nr:D-aminoacylase [Gemmatimonadaceae bacterium]MCW5826299.1 D-aminoacylase [Gemmatimonadaceae bacterium]